MSNYYKIGKMPFRRGLKMDINKITIPLHQLLKKGVKNSTSMLLYGVIVFHSYHQDATWVSNRTLAKELDISERQVQNCLKDLLEHDCIDITNEKDEQNRDIRNITPKVMPPVKYVSNTYGNSKKDDNGGFTML